MEVVKLFRRNLINARKRFNFFKFNLEYRWQRGNMYDIGHDIQSLQKEHRSINILDFSRKEDFYLIDEFSDAVEYGGLSETGLALNEEDKCLTMQAKFQRMPEGYDISSQVMFCGFDCVHLFTKEFDNYNGMRVTMR